jgi:multidrug transporter EmrE-like cation transporter
MFLYKQTPNIAAIVGIIMIVVDVMIINLFSKTVG